MNLFYNAQMLSKFNAIIHLQLNFFLLLLSVSVLPFLVLNYYFSQIPNMHIFFLGVLLLLRFLLPEGVGVNSDKVKKYLQKRGKLSNQRVVEYKIMLKSSKDIFLITIAMLIFFVGIN